eukprot:Lithocolla_globosa_v1_NODE_1555_length_2489_cov_9.147083.p1 type:complete len:563 gc:universal NODE_1555_length_2489_cov_9.147083:2271-583(-)
MTQFREVVSMKVNESPPSPPPGPPPCRYRDEDVQQLEDAIDFDEKMFDASVQAGMDAVNEKEDVEAFESFLSEILDLHIDDVRDPDPEEELDEDDMFGPLTTAKVLRENYENNRSQGSLALEKQLENHWSRWAIHRNKVVRKLIAEVMNNHDELQQQLKKDGFVPENFEAITTEELVFWSPRFITEVRMFVNGRQGERCSADRLWALACSMKRFFKNRSRVYNLIPNKDNPDTTFKAFWDALNAEMKTSTRLGIGLGKGTPPDIVNAEQKLMLFQDGHLGAKNPTVLLDTVYWLNTEYYGLRGRDQHSTMILSQISKEYDPDQCSKYREFDETRSKTNSGEVFHRKRKRDPARCYDQPANIYNPHIYWNLFDDYRPKDCKHDFYYLTPNPNWEKSGVWFKRTKVGINQFTKIVPRVMKRANVKGRWTAHSLKYSTKTHLERSGVNERLQMNHFGASGVSSSRRYNRTSNKQQKMLSDTLAVGRMPTSLVAEQSDNVVAMNNQGSSRQHAEAHLVENPMNNQGSSRQHASEPEVRLIEDGSRQQNSLEPAVKQGNVFNFTFRL